MWIQSIFSTILNMSLTASVVILVICVARLAMKKAPKIYSYLLWGLVLFRLLCPVSLLTSFSVIPVRISSGEVVSDWEAGYIEQVQVHYDDDITYEAAVNAGREPVSVEKGNDYVVTGNDGISEPKTVKNTVMPLLAVIWAAGIPTVLLPGVISYIRIKRMTKVVIPLRKNIYIGDDVESPFVIGIFCPVIYLPRTLDASEREYIIAHENHHIRRGDHVFKALGFLALAVHWFNPLVWLAFALAVRDMEMSCDEAVIRKLGEKVRADYSASLLKLATGSRLFTANPLAFGENDPAGRVRNLSKWKKPALWVIILCVLICIALALMLLTNLDLKHPESDNKTPGTTMSPTEETTPDKTESVAGENSAISETDGVVMLQKPLSALPELYSAEQAMIDGCFVQINGVATDNKDKFFKFASDSRAGVHSSIRIINWYIGDKSHYTAMDLSFADSVYTATWFENGVEHTKQFRYLVHFVGEKEQENIDYDAYERYVLLDDNQVSWDEIWHSLISSQRPGGIEHMTVYSDYIYYPEFVIIPEPIAKAELVLEGNTLITVTDSTQLDKIRNLFHNRQFLGYEPKTHGIGVGLNLILTDRSGKKVEIELDADPNRDVCRINGEYVFYGAFDEPSYVAKLWDALNISQWPEQVYQKYPSVSRKIG
jgi:beta-lactamase regulating signal transducer with metallopeptidase domain